ncbi:hypothetical protein CFIMG_001989RA [Ceratocystis fimbriata CBS 114723]|uniref:Large ribosomal subunit protein mL54 n=1 Tax=Ceratocystis fimbriata CBS 114723 TaxID=1035309 RepID=A0A2C5X3T2_9PEZI|nr:hypothetical protein CFIMG_001989RA [Ceratocystis fimbriata CBS 114723]
MILRNCLVRASTAARQPAVFRAFSASSLRLSATTEAASSEATTTTPSETGTSALDNNSTSSCPAGTVLKGLNFLNGQQDPVALPDEAYPTWLWKCLEVKERVKDESEDLAAIEFSKSKKQRRIAAKKARQIEADMMASGDMSALAPKIPLHEQSINLPGSLEGGFDDSMEAAEARAKLKKALRKDRKAKIKEANYLNTM